MVVETGGPNNGCTVKPRETEIKFVTKTVFYSQATAKCSILALHNAHNYVRVL